MAANGRKCCVCNKNVIHFESIDIISKLYKGDVGYTDGKDVCSEACYAASPWYTEADNETTWDWEALAAEASASTSKGKRSMYNKWYLISQNILIIIRKTAAVE